MRLKQGRPKKLRGIKSDLLLSLSTSMSDTAEGISIRDTNGPGSYHLTRGVTEDCDWLNSEGAEEGAEADLNRHNAGELNFNLRENLLGHGGRAAETVVLLEGDLGVLVVEPVKLVNRLTKRVRSVRERKGRTGRRRNGGKEQLPYEDGGSPGPRRGTRPEACPCFAGHQQQGPP